MEFFDPNIILLNTLSQTMGIDFYCSCQFTMFYEPNIFINSNLLANNNLLYYNNYYFVIDNYYLDTANVALFVLYNNITFFDIFVNPLNIKNYNILQNSILINNTVLHYYYFKNVIIIFNLLNIFKYVDIFWNCFYSLVIEHDYVLIKKSINLFDFFIKYNHLENKLLRYIIAYFENIINFCNLTEINFGQITKYLIVNVDNTDYCWYYHFSIIKFCFSIWFIIFFIIVLVYICKKIINHTFTKNMKHIFRKCYKRVKFLRLLKLINLRKQNFTLLWNAYKAVFLKSQDLKLTTNVYLWPYLATIKNRHNMETWRIYHNKVYMYELALILLNLKLRVFYYYFYLVISLIKYFLIEIIKILPLFIFESVFKIINFNKKLLNIWIKNKITYNFYRNIWSGLVIIYNYIAHWFFLPIHIFSLPLILFFKVRLPYYYRLSTYVEYPVNLPNNLKFLFRQFNPLHEYNVILLKYNVQIINFIYLICNNIQIKYIKFIISWQYKGVPIINLFWLSVGLLIKLLSKIFLFYYLYVFLVKLYNILTLLITFIFNCFVKFSYIAYNKSNTLFDLLYAIIYLIYRNIIGSIIGLIRWSFLLPLILIGRYKYMIMFIIISYYFLIEFTYILNFIFWLFSVYPIGNIITFIREQHYEFYVAWMIIDNASFLDNSLIIYNDQLYGYFTAKEEFKRVGNVWIDFSKRNELSIPLPFFFSYFGFDDYLILKYYKFKPLLVDGIVINIVLKVFVVISWYHYLLHYFISLYLQKTVFIFLTSLATPMKIYCLLKYILYTIYYILFMLFWHVQTIWLYFVPFVINEFYNFINLYFIFYDEFFYGNHLFNFIIRGYILYNKMFINYVINILLYYLYLIYDLVNLILSLIMSQLKNNIINENRSEKLSYTKVLIDSLEYDIEEFSFFYIYDTTWYENPDIQINIPAYYLFFQFQEVNINNLYMELWFNLWTSWKLTRYLVFLFLVDIYYYMDHKIIDFDVPLFFHLQYVISYLYIYFVDSWADYSRFMFFKNKYEILNITNVELDYFERSQHWNFSMYRSPKNTILNYLESFFLCQLVLNLGEFYSNDLIYTLYPRWSIFMDAEEAIDIIDEEGIYDYASVFYYENVELLSTPLLYRSFFSKSHCMMLILPRIAFLCIIYYCYSFFSVGIGKPEYFYNIFICEKNIEIYYFKYIT